MWLIFPKVPLSENRDTVCIFPQPQPPMRLIPAVCEGASLATCSGIQKGECSETTVSPAIYKSRCQADCLVHQIESDVLSNMSGTNGVLPVRGPSMATRLREQIASTKAIIIAPGVYDGVSARTALEVGFDCLYMVSMSPGTKS